MSKEIITKDNNGKEIELDLGPFYVMSNIGILLGKLVNDIWSDIFDDKSKDK